MAQHPIHITVPGSDADPRAPEELDGVVVHRVPPMHPDDVTVLGGMRVTTVARTLVDLAQDTSPAELRAIFRNAEQRGLLDIEAVRASAARVEWRPSLATLHAVIEEFDR